MKGTKGVAGRVDGKRWGGVGRRSEAQNASKRLARTVSRGGFGWVVPVASTGKVVVGARVCVRVLCLVDVCMCMHVCVCVEEMGDGVEKNKKKAANDDTRPSRHTHTNPFITA